MLTLRPPQYNTDNFLANGTVIPRTFGDVTIDDYGWGGDGEFRRWYQGPAYYYEAGSVAVPVRGHPPRRRRGPSGRRVLGRGHDRRTRSVPTSASSTCWGSVTPSPHISRWRRHWFREWIASPATRSRCPRRGSPHDSRRSDTRPDPKDFPVFANPLIPPTTGTEFQEQVASARAAMRCDEIAEIVRATEAPMSASRFAHNLLHSVRTTTARIPADPEDAYHRYCGPETPPEVQEIRGG